MALYPGAWPLYGHRSFRLYRQQQGLRLILPVMCPLFAHRADDPERKLSGMVLNAKSDLYHQLQRIMERSCCIFRSFPGAFMKLIKAARENIHMQAPRNPISPAAAVNKSRGGPDFLSGGTA